MINAAEEASFNQLYADIQQVFAAYQEMRSQAAGILDKTDMPDAAAQLKEVLQSTEDATTIILDSVSAINEIATSCAASESLQQIEAHVTRVYEACSFQDITGQRIKKVLESLSLLEAGLARLSETVDASVKPKAAAPVAPMSDKHLMSGPQLAANAPSQSEVDKLFGS